MASRLSVLLAHKRGRRRVTRLALIADECGTPAINEGKRWDGDAKLEVNGKGGPLMKSRGLFRRRR